MCKGDSSEAICTQVIYNNIAVSIAHIIFLTVMDNTVATYRKLNDYNSLLK